MEKQDIKENILDAARKLLLKHGYENLSMRKIAGEVGCKAATLYYYYRNKEEIIQELVDEGNRLHFRISKEIAQKQANPLLRFEALLWTTLEFGVNNPAYFEILYLLTGHELSEAANRLSAPSQELGVDALRECVMQGLVTVDSPYITSASCFAMVNGLVVAILRNHFDPALNIETIKKETIRRIMDSLKKKNKPMIEDRV